MSIVKVKVNVKVGLKILRCKKTKTASLKLFPSFVFCSYAINKITSCTKTNFLLAKPQICCFCNYVANLHYFSVLSKKNAGKL